MAEVIWSPSALRDFDGILAYIAKDAPGAARRLGAKVISRTRQLKMSPLSGGFVLEDGTRTYRELLHGNYRIIYRYDEERDVAYLVAIHYAARLLDPGTLN